MEFSPGACWDHTESLKNIQFVKVGAGGRGCSDKMATLGVIMLMGMFSIPAMGVDATCTCDTIVWKSHTHTHKSKYNGNSEQGWCTVPTSISWL